ncbi:hypothetical protein [Mesorhizobium sp. M8A.F.Ca.ET.165.01.1.1]|uniref:hypothetical protein n=1 Tax=Mesorhizobium sp. M8A.F.Ca.ET.165.01.1.1 TaxID=2563960 RepID=UPI001093A911|nr:hypothetical protein [Mesorhizobium sp. M8A.F.Ca.ET.165.01.1.1]TGT46346.1 hypothetical protein EN808_03415 [Mesorhizobium sp. M8A.F.Ca.ET.165.01.1.1]
MTITIKITTQFEPQEFHGTILAPSWTHIFSAAFGFASDDLSTAEAAVRNFLSNVKDVRLLAYRLEVDINDPMNKGKLVREHTVSAEMGEWGSPLGLAKDLGQWLTDRSGGRWSESVPSGEVDYHDLGAGHLLDSVANWPAPLPQVAGLVRLVRATAATAIKESSVVLLPMFDKAPGAPPDEISCELGQGSEDGQTAVRVSVPGNGAMPDYDVKASTLLIPTEDPGSLIDAASGYLKVQPRNVQTAVSLKRIREAGPSLLWTLPQVQSLLPDDKAMMGAVTVAPTLTDLKRALWLGVNGLVTLLDPAYLALTMAESQREGPFVAALIALLEEENREQQKNNQNPIEFNLTGFATKVRDKIVAAALGNAKANEPAVPSTLGTLLSTAFNIPEPADPLDGQATLLPLLLSLFKKYAPANLPMDAAAAAVSWQQHFGTTLERQVLTELGLLSKKMQEESGLEEVAKNVLAQAGVDAAWLLGLITNKPTEGPAHAANMIVRFHSLIDDSFNGLDATRLAQGSLFQSHLVSDARTEMKGGEWDDHCLKERLVRSRWFEARLRLFDPSKANKVSSPKMMELAKCLPGVSTDWLEAGAKQSFERSLNKALLLVARDLFPAATSRFLPDPVPRNIPVQIAVDTDINDADTFHQRYNGIALLVRRQGTSWRYANLAELKQNYQIDGYTFAQQTIEPLQPIAVDGERSLYFEYSGLPLASSAFIDTKSVDAPKADDLKPFYDVDDPAAPIGGKLPALAYGETYDLAAHVIGKAGTLPQNLQITPQTPWLPGTIPSETTMPPTPVVPTKPHLVQTYAYRRTTAIGRVMLTERLSPGDDPRIGTALSGVLPLSKDYPRLCLSASNTSNGLLDVLRNSDGTGSISLPDNDNPRVEIVIKDMWWWANAGTLTATFLNQAKALPDLEGQTPFSFPATAPFCGGSIAIRIDYNKDAQDYTYWIGVSQTGDAVAKLTEVPSPIPVTKNPLWLRLRLVSKSQGASVSFADPTGASLTSSSASRRGGDSTLMLAENDANVWRPEVRKPVNGLVQFPRMTFSDFDRWIASDTLKGAAFPPKNADAGVFHINVMTAYVGRMQNQALSALADQLPDLAVSGLQLELTAVDGLDVGKKDQTTPSKMVASSKLTPKYAHVPIDELGKWPELRETSIHRMLQQISDAAAARLEARCEGEELVLKAVEEKVGPGIPRWKVTVIVPKGIVAKLKIRALVSETLFGEGKSAQPVIDKGIRQLAVAHSSGMYQFEGPTLTIEAMTGVLDDVEHGWPNLAARALVVRPAGRQRSYDLLADGSLLIGEADAWHWRILGGIETKTQRWRFTGRPIYSWLDPKQGKPHFEPAFRIADTVNGLNEFETEAFFDHDDEDGDTPPAKQLDPAPAATLLQSFPWAEQSATMFRHRLTLHSRYAGAILPSKRSTQPAYESGDWVRMAMLADPTRLQLTRPQLRALMPLTVAASQRDSDAGAPPVMAVLDERPFAHGGLADRISAEIRTGFGFGFETTPPGVHVVDSRKEFGPDPRLHYRPTSENDARALTLESEGPIGLTFDTPTAPAPTYANCAYLLKPRFAREQDAGAGSLEEHFLSVAMRRYLDHRWVLDAEIAPKKVLTSETAWIEFGQDFTLSVLGRDVLRVKAVNGKWIASVLPVMIDPKGPQQLPECEIATAEQRFASQMALLHLPLEEGRASLTLFALPGAMTSSPKPNFRSAGSIAAGESNLPHVMASFEWTVPPEALTLDFNVVPRIAPTAASAVTHMNWTRTGKSFDVIEALHANGEERIDVRELTVLRLKDNEVANLVRKTDQLVIAAVPRLEKNPLFVHRHAAAISTQWAEGIGRPIEIYKGARLVAGSAINGMPDKTAGGALRLVTFETPARPIAFDSQLPEMNRATFDVYAVLGDKFVGSSKPAGLTFFYRPLGDTTGNKALSQIAFTVSINPDNKAAKFTFNITVPVNSSALNSVRFSIVDGKVLSTCVFTDGKALSAKTSIVDGTPTLPFGEFESITLVPSNFLDGKGKSLCAFWGDISMLTLSSGQDPTAFSWDWLFTGSGLDAGVAVSPVRLSSMPEAQARIISISPPIPVL